MLRKGHWKDGIHREDNCTENYNFYKGLHLSSSRDPEAPAIPGKGSCLTVLSWAIQKQNITRTIKITVAVVEQSTACPIGGVYASGDASLMIVYTCQCCLIPDLIYPIRAMSHVKDTAKRNRAYWERGDILPHWIGPSVLALRCMITSRIRRIRATLNVDSTCGTDARTLNAVGTRYP